MWERCDRGFATIISLHLYATALPLSCFCKNLFPFRSLLHVAARVNFYKMIEQCTPDHVNSLQKIFLADSLPSRKRLHTPNHRTHCLLLSIFSHLSLPLILCTRYRAIYGYLKCHTLYLSLGSSLIPPPRRTLSPLGWLILWTLLLEVVSSCKLFLWYLECFLSQPFSSFFPLLQAKFLKYSQYLINTQIIEPLTLV